ncbi:hypothetical protein Q1695_014874 [Nippostrongylus brasiliensis]|nr:hypothetical protein Q1695_014874 [Nippostrongylus brasiliensis]
MQRPLVIVVAAAMLVVLVSSQRDEQLPEMSRYFMDELRSNEYLPLQTKGADAKRKQFYAWAGKRSDGTFEKRKQFYAWAGK